MIPWGMFPFNDDLKKLNEQMNPNEIQKYVNKIMNQHLDQWNNPARNEEIQNSTQQGRSESTQTEVAHADVFETFDDIFIRIHLPDKEAHKRLRIFHTSNQAIIENFPLEGDRQTITLPRLVKRKGATARIKDQILELKMPINIDMQFSEIDISENP